MSVGDLTNSQQVAYFEKIEYLLEKEANLLDLESAEYLREMAEYMEASKKRQGDDAGIQSYSWLDPDVAKDHILRDEQALLKIQEDDDLRHYIEKKIGKKAEEIFNYAHKNSKS